MPGSERLTITHFLQPAGFLRVAQPYLEAYEVANSLILGVAIRLCEHPEWTDTQPYLGIVENEGEVELVAVITPPHNLLIAGTQDPPPGVIELLIRELRSGGWSFPGIKAESQLALRFVQTWAEVVGNRCEIRMRLRAYELRHVVPPHPVSGHLLPAALDNLDLVAAWRAAFTCESIRIEPPKNDREATLRSIQAGRIYLWSDLDPVSMAAITRSTPHGISIGGVYTPPEYRRRGYASACVAELSQHQLDQGKSFCALFTDLDYPASNSIYQKIGYRPVCDFTEYAFNSNRPVNLLGEAPAPIP